MISMNTAVACTLQLTEAQRLSSPDEWPSNKEPALLQPTWQPSGEMKPTVGDGPRFLFALGASIIPQSSRPSIQRKMSDGATII